MIQVIKSSSLHHPLSLESVRCKQLKSMRRKNGQMLITSSSYMSVLSSTREREKKENADSVLLPVVANMKSNLFSSCSRALIDQQACRRFSSHSDLLPLLILDERVSNRIYANQLHL